MARQRGGRSTRSVGSSSQGRTRGPSIAIPDDANPPTYLLGDIQRDEVPTTDFESDVPNSEYRVVSNMMEIEEPDGPIRRGRFRFRIVRVQKEGSNNVIVIFDVAPTRELCFKAKSVWKELCVRSTATSPFEPVLGQRRVQEVVHFNAFWAMRNVLGERDVNLQNLPSLELPNKLQIERRGWASYFQKNADNEINMMIYRLFVASLVQLVEHDPFTWEAYVRDIRIPLNLREMEFWTGVPSLPDDGPGTFLWPTRDSCPESFTSANEVTTWLFGNGRAWNHKTSLKMGRLRNQSDVRSKTWLVVDHLAVGNRQLFSSYQAHLSYVLHQNRPICLNRTIMKGVTDLVDAPDTLPIEFGVFITQLCKRFGVEVYLEDEKKRRLRAVDKKVFNQSAGHRKDKEIVSDEEEDEVEAAIPEHDDEVPFESDSDAFRARPCKRTAAASSARFSTGAEYGDARIARDEFYASDRGASMPARRSFEEVVISRLHKIEQEQERALQDRQVAKKERGKIMRTLVKLKNKLFGSSSASLSSRSRSEGGAQTGRARGEAEVSSHYRAPVVDLEEEVEQVQELIEQPREEEIEVHNQWEQPNPWDIAVQQALWQNAPR